MISKMNTKMMVLECFIFGLILMTGARSEVVEVFAEVGSQAVLPCQDRSHTSTAVSWKKANQGTVWRKERSGLQFWGASWSQKGTQRVQSSYNLFGTGDYSLQINNVREEDAGIYSCMVGHVQQAAETVISLRVTRVSVSQSEPIWGEYVSINCSVTPWPHGATVHWMLNNRPFGTQDGITSNNVLKEKASARLTGEWTCVVGYRHKEGRASAALSVKGITQPPNDDTKVYAAVGSAVRLPCIFSHGLIPSAPLWEKLQPGSRFKQARSSLPPSFSVSSQSIQPSWDKSASLTEVEFKDEGRYRCSGTVEAQRLTRNIQLVVAQIDSSVLSKKKGSMALTCQLSETSEVTSYEWVHVTYDLNGTQSFGPIQKGKTLNISRVSEENSGEWTCQFYGKEGILGNITYHVQLMGGLSGQKSTGVSQNTAAVVGLSFLFVVLLLILAQMYKNHQRRKRIFQYPALETIVHTISNEREERERSRVKQ